jgi:hypothetical protein
LIIRNLEKDFPAVRYVNYFMFEKKFAFNMKEIFVVFTIILLLFSTTGCTDKLLPQRTNVTTIPTPVPTPKYGIGDIVIKNPGDLIGMVITNYNQGSYSARTVIFDRYGTVFYYEGGGTSMPISQFESMYPLKKAHIENPYDLKTFDKEYDEKYGVGQIVTKKDNAIEGIKIISYDYPKDVYTYVSVTRRSGSWVNNSDTIFTGSRTDIERWYEKIKTS